MAIYIYIQEVVGGRIKKCEDSERDESTDEQLQAREHARLMVHCPLLWLCLNTSLLMPESMVFRTMFPTYA